jgi:hypothetical protein
MRTESKRVKSKQKGKTIEYQIMKIVLKAEPRLLSKYQKLVTTILAKSFKRLLTE